MIVCTTCKGSLQTEGASLICSDCGARYSVRNNVPLMTPPEQTINRIELLKAHLNIPHVDSEAIGEALMTATGYFYNRPGLEQEFSNIVGRFPGIEIQRPEPAVATSPGGIRLKAITSLLRPQFLPDEHTTRSIRLRNDTPETFATQGPNPYHLSYHLYDQAGNLITYEGERSGFPIEFLPGSELTVPLWVRAPKTPGRYRLDVVSVQEGVRWHEEVILRVEIDVDPAHIQNPREIGFTGDFDYAADFGASVAVTREAIANVANPEVLEVACGLYPVSANLIGEGVRLTAADLCWPELQMSSLIYNHHDKSAIRFVCADVEALPFQKASFDAVVICAALHHFPDPGSTLWELKSFLKPGGALVLLREPCTVNIGDVNYLADLRRGFNEQQFRTEEYEDMVERAGFDIVKTRIDFGGSLKLIAR